MKIFLMIFCLAVSGTALAMERETLVGGVGDVEHGGFGEQLGSEHSFF